MNLAYSHFLSSITYNDVYYLDCSGLETGTHKDLRSRFIIDYALHSEIRSLHIITKGNAGVSLKKVIDAANADISLVHIVPHSLDERIVALLRGQKSHVIKMNLDEQLISACALANLVSPGSYDATYVEGPQYDPMIKELLSISPDYVIVPVGSGELFNCIYNHLSGYRLGTKLIGIIPKGNHPLSSISAYEKSLADKLACTFIQPQAMQKIKKSLREGHQILEISNADITNCLEIGTNLGLKTEPSAAVALYALHRLQGKKVVCVMTGKGHASIP